MKFLLLALSLMSFAAAADVQSDQLFAAKVSFEKKAYELKIAHEKAVNKIQQKSISDILNKDDSTCFDWVYQSSATREQAEAACRGVRSLECAQWVYQGPSSRLESVEVCRGVRDMECVQWVYQGPGSRAEAAAACSGVRDMDCVRRVYQGPSSRIESAQACGHGAPAPRPRPNECNL